METDETEPVILAVAEAPLPPPPPVKVIVGALV
jgi:hypothetical protein